jgi:hypothetical protein
MSFAWETTVDDVENVLRRMGRTGMGSVSIHGMLDHEAIEKAALRGNDMSDQTEGAYDEIERQIKEGKL